MKYGLEEIRNTLAKISQDDSLLDMLCEFERTLDKTGVYAYQNWLNGELISGPDVERFWFKTAWLYRKDEMPDPDAALRLEKIGCKVWYTDAVLKQPVKISSPASWENQTSKAAKMIDTPVWIVHIHMPIKYITDGNDDIHDLISSEVNYGDQVPDTDLPENQ